MKTLVVGCDASGKTTLLENIHNVYGDRIGESSKSERVQFFKKLSAARLVDSDFIEERESLYLSISDGSLTSESESEHFNIVTTDSSLVTRISHDVMRRILNLQGLSDEEIISRWAEDEQRFNIAHPDIVVLTHAPSSVIRDRIIERQKLGISNEAFWGFNSPYFLNAYQTRWQSLIPKLSILSISSLSIDTDVTPQDQSITIYDSVRRAK